MCGDTRRAGAVLEEPTNETMMSTVTHLPPAAHGRPALDHDALAAALLRPGGPLRHLEVRPTDPSTNTSLAAASTSDPGTWRAPAALLADHQVAGRGRLGRVWQTPARTALTMSVLLAPRARPLTWVPLLTGLAVCAAVHEATGLDVGLKWPNDVLVAVPGADELPVVGRRRKVAGILAEVTPAGQVVVGVGLNVLQSADELPVAAATSLAAALLGADGPSHVAPSRDDLAVAVLTRLLATIDRWDAAAGRSRDSDAIVTSGLLADVEQRLVTLGSLVRAELTDGREVTGEAVGLAPDGALVIASDDGRRTEVRSGDVHHLRAPLRPTSG